VVGRKRSCRIAAAAAGRPTPVRGTTLQRQSQEPTRTSSQAFARAKDQGVILPSITEPLLDERDLPRRLGRDRMPPALLHHAPLAADQFQRLRRGEALLAQQAADDGAGPAHAAPAVEVHRVAGFQRAVDRIERGGIVPTAGTSMSGIANRRWATCTWRDQARSRRIGTYRSGPSKNSVGSTNCRTLASSRASIRTTQSRFASRPRALFLHLSSVPHRRPEDRPSFRLPHLARQRSLLLTHDFTATSVCYNIVGTHGGCA
jgi:hypothetical protein